MNNYDLCCRYQGKVVHIYERCGKVHHGRIVKVDQEYVWIDPMARAPRGFGYGYSYGYGYGGGYPGYGGGNPSVVPVALAAIGGLALGAAFFW